MFPLQVGLNDHHKCWIKWSRSHDRSELVRTEGYSISGQHQPPLALVWWNISVFMDSEFLALPPSWLSWCLTRQLADFSTTIQLLEIFISAISDGCRHWENVIHTNDNSQISSNLLICQSRMRPASPSHQLWYITRLGDLNDVWHHFTN